MKVEAFSKIAAKVLGYIILAGSLTLKMPQIYNIVSNQTAEGLSPLSFYVDVYLYITSTVYNVLQNNPFSSYGDNVSILIQNIILVFVLWYYTKPSPSAFVILSVLVSFIAVYAVSVSLPKAYQPALVLINLPLIVVSRLPQIFKNISQKSTGQLSLPTYFLQTAGSTVRIFTTIQEVGWDLPLLSGFIIGSSLNGVLLLQIIYYNFIKKPVAAEKKRE